MKKTMCITLCLVLAIICLTGCKNGRDQDAITGAKVDLLIGNPNGDALTPQSIVDGFIEKTKNRYNVTTDESSWGDFAQKMKMQMVAKDDVIPVFVTDSGATASFGAQGSLADLKKRVDRDLDASLYNKALYAATDLEGHLWGVPHAMNSIAIVYNKKIFDAAGIAYPKADWTWEEMLELSKELTQDKDGDGKTDIYGIAYGYNITQGWLPFMTAVGVNPFSDTLDRSNLKDPKVKQAYEYYSKPIEEGWVPDAAWEAAEGGAQMAFANGKIAMVLCQSSNLKVINNNLTDACDYDAIEMPVGWNGKRSLIYVPNMWVVYSGASEQVKDAAWEWICYYMSEESQKVVALEGPAGYPIMKSALELVGKSDTLPKNKEVFYKGIDEYGLTLLEHPAWSSTRAIVDTLTSKIRNGEGTIDDLIKEYDVLLQEEYDFYYENYKK